MEYMKKKIFFLLVFLLLSETFFGQITEIGKASFYADKFDGRVTASGEIFDQNELTAAHRTLPFGAKVKVTNLDNQKSVIVKINDRGPFVNDRVIDLSKSAARQLDFIKKGVAKVKVEVLKLPDGKKTNNYDYSFSGGKTKVSKKESEVKIKKANNENGLIASQAIDYYKLRTEKTNPIGFGIQVASYQEAANLIKRCNEIEQETRKTVFVQIGENNNSKVYRIIIGTFSSRGKANDFNESIQGKFKGSFVVEF